MASGVIFIFRVSENFFSLGMNNNRQHLDFAYYEAGTAKVL